MSLRSACIRNSVPSATGESVRLWTASLQAGVAPLIKNKAVYPCNVLPHTGDTIEGAPSYTVANRDQ